MAIFLRSKRGGQKLLHNGYEYDKQKCYNEKIYWQCSMKRDCKARAHTVDGEVVQTLNEHTHAPCQLRLEAKLAYAAMKERAKLTEETNQSITSSFINKMTPEGRSYLPHQDVIKRTLRRSRAKEQRPHLLPSSVREISIPDERHYNRARMPRATSSMPEGCVITVSTDRAHSQDVSCLSRETQATTTTSVIGTQCALMLFISASSQTEEEFPVLEVNDTQACTSKKFPVSREGADIAAKAGPHSCSCRPQSGNTGSSPKDKEEIQFRGKLYSCVSCQQCNHETTHGKDCSSKKTFVCTVCKEVFHKKHTLDSHMGVHTSGRPYISTISSASFTQKCILYSHHARLHSGDKPAKRRVCQTTFTNGCQLANHERSQPVKKPHVCSTCQKRFTKSGDLVRHERLHTGQRPYVCSICQKSFTQRSNLVTHEKLHLGERPHVCSICQQCFTKRGDLVRHERVHSGERPFVCRICQKSFKEKRQLVNHERLHSGERPYMCSTCQKSFTQKASLVAHERVHSGERPYMCGICHKSFNQRSNLTTHERLHSGDRPHVCGICNKGFTKRSHLVNHERLHSGNKP